VIGQPNPCAGIAAQRRYNRALDRRYSGLSATSLIEVIVWCSISQHSISI
jgi:hypothetical protein